MRSVAFTNDRGYALGHNPNAPSPFVTWTFYENADGSRDYNWGHYFKDEEAAVRDFAHRAAEHRYQFGRGGTGGRTASGRSRGITAITPPKGRWT